MIPTLCKRNSYQRGAPGVSELIGGGSFEDNNSSDDDDFLNQGQPVSEDGVTPKYRRDTTRVGLGKGCRSECLESTENICHEYICHGTPWCERILVIN